MEAIGELVENVRSGSESKWEYTVIIEMLLPVNAQEEAVSRAEWTQPQSAANIDFCQVYPGPTAIICEMAMSTVAYSGLKSSLGILSLTLSPSGDDKS